MIDFSGSKDNAAMLVQRFIETGEQPDFMEFLCFKNCYVDAVFYGYSSDYILNKFRVYVGISKFKNTEYKCENRQERMKEVEHCYSACTGKDFIEEASRRGLKFLVVDGKLQLAKKTKQQAQEDLLIIKNSRSKANA